MKMTSNGKFLNYKVVDLVESYTFHIKFTSIRVQTKKNTNFCKETGPLPPWPTAAGGATAPRASYRRGARRRQMYSFAKFFVDHIFLQN
jgi:hypothetical protein